MILHIVVLQKQARFLVIVFILNAVIAAILLFLLEGVVGIARFIRTFNSDGVVAESRHTIYDSDIGWVNKPGVIIPDMYGKENTLTILSDQSRFTDTPTTRLEHRIICSGDSFTFGYGVNDSDTWCSLLSRYGASSVNLGQGGYGIDQSYLWYSRKASVIPHDTHIAAFTLYDFYRVFTPVFVGYGKPYFRMVGGELKNVNNPVPLPQPLARFFITHQKSFNKLHLYALARKFNGIREPVRTPAVEQAPIIEALITKLYTATTERGAKFIMVLLPTRQDYYNRKPYDDRRADMTKLSHDVGFNFVDLGDVFFALDQSTFNALFIPDESMSYYDAGGHYTDRAHEIVARELYDFLQNLSAN